MIENNKTIVAAFLSSMFFILLIIIDSLFQPLDPFFLVTGNACSSMMFCDLIRISWVMLFLVLINAYTAQKIWRQLNNKKTKTFLIIALLLVYLVSLPLIIVNNARCKSRVSSSIASMRQIATAQELYYNEHSSYADNFDLLKEFLSQAPLDPWTQELYTDSDGVGIEASDEDGETWEIKAFIHQDQYSLCYKQSQGYWAICNQDGCSFK